MQNQKLCLQNDYLLFLTNLYSIWSKTKFMYSLVINELVFILFLIDKWLITEFNKSIFLSTSS